MLILANLQQLIQESMAFVYCWLQKLLLRDFLKSVNQNGGFVHLFLRSSFGDSTPFLGKTLRYTFVFLNSTFSKSTAPTYPSPEPNPCPVRSRRFKPYSSNNVLNEEKKRSTEHSKINEQFSNERSTDEQINGSSDLEIEVLRDL